MWKPKLRPIVTGALLFLLGISCCWFVPRLLSSIFPVSPAHSSEDLRVTSPDGQFDAVMVYETYGGAIGGTDWFLYIVRKGRPAPTDHEKALFWADSLRGEKISWNQPHLLEFQYDRAQIVKFRNLWGLYEIEDVGAYGQRDFDIELRLAPTSPDYSLLRANGEFAH